MLYELSVFNETSRTLYFSVNSVTAFEAMARIAKITVYQDGERYGVNVPGSLSPTGKRRRSFFRSIKKANEEKKRLSDQLNNFGKESTISPSLATDALKAANLLKPFNLSLTEAARMAADQKKRQNASVTFAEAWGIHLESLAAKSEKHKRETGYIGKKLLSDFGKKLVADIGGEELERALSAHYKTPHGFNLALRSLSPVFNRAHRKGWAGENICLRIEKRDTGRREVRFLSVEEAKNVLGAVRDHRENKALPQYLRKNCSDTLAPVALMLFAGVRPNEVARLTWENVDLSEGTVFISNVKAKTDRSRYFEMPDTLRKWLETIPPEERPKGGTIVPRNWPTKWKAVRYAAGIKEIPDILRKTFVTYHLAANGDINKTRQIIGHEVGDTLFSYYRGAAAKKRGEEFFRLTPGWGAPTSRDQGKTNPSGTGGPS